MLQLCQCRQWFDVCSEQLTSQKLQWVGGRVPVAAQPEGTPGALMDDDEAGAQYPHRPSARLVRCSIGSQSKKRFSGAFVNVPSRRGNLRGLADQIRQGISSSAKSRTSVPGTAHAILAVDFE